jgi:hypothetical protein
MGTTGRDHIVINANKGGRFECRNCGVTEDPGYPIGLDAAIDKGKIFSDDHRNCVDNAVKKLTFRGHSDDNVCIHTTQKLHDKVVGNSNEYGCFKAGVGIVMAAFVIGKAMQVTCLYDGCWSFAVGQVDEEIPLPEWPVVLKGSEGYTSILEITVPSMAELERADAAAD